MLYAETVGFANGQSSINLISLQPNSLTEYISRIASTQKKMSLIQAAIKLGNEALCNLVLKYFIAFMFYLSAELSYP